MVKWLVLFLLLVSPAYGATYYVAASGGDYSTVAQVNAASFASGDIVSFNKGEQFDGNLSCKIGVTYNSYGIGTNPILNGISSNVSIINIVNVNNIVIDGIDIKDNGYVHTGYCSIYIYNSNNIVIKNCTLNLNAHYKGINIAANNSMEESAHDIIIKDNVVDGGYEIGMQCYSSLASGLVYNITISHNIVSNVTPSVLYGAGHGINIGWYSSNVVVERNYLYHNIRYGIVVDSGVSNVVIKNNICYDNVYNIGSENDSLHGGNDNIKFYNNTLIYGATTISAGFRFADGYEGNNYEIKNNIIIGNSDTVSFIDDSSNTLVNLVSDYNCFYNSTGNFPKFTYNGTTYVGLTDWQGAGFDAHSNTTNPTLTGFIPKSSCINTGITLLSVLDDYNGSLRPVSSGYDIGAVETGASFIRNATLQTVSVK
jgi:hypothetical protein